MPKEPTIAFYIMGPLVLDLVLLMTGDNGLETAVRRVCHEGQLWVFPADAERGKRPITEVTTGEVL